MRTEIQTAIRSAMVASTALTEALGAASLIHYAWDTDEVLPNLSGTNKVALFWGADLSEGDQPHSGNATLKREPDVSVTFHLFGFNIENVNTACEALIDLFNESTLSTTNYKIYRIKRSGDTVLYEAPYRCWHRAISMSFQEIWKQT